MDTRAPILSIDVIFGQLQRRVDIPRVRPPLPGNSSPSNASASSLSSSSSLGFPYLFPFFTASSGSHLASVARSSASNHAATGASSAPSTPSPSSSQHQRQQQQEQEAASPVQPSAGDTLATSGTWTPTPGNERLRIALRQQQDTLDTVSEDGPLRKELWHGVVEQPLLRAEAWRVAIGVSPATVSRRNRDTLRHLNEYRDYLELYYYEMKRKQPQQHHHQPSLSASSSQILPLLASSKPHTPIGDQQQSPVISLAVSLTTPSFPPVDTPVPDIERRTKTERDILHQLEIDLPRHKLALYKHPELVERLRRCLYVWSLRNPAVGYVQGMDDIVVVFFYAFLDEAFAMMGEFQRRRNDANCKKFVATESSPHTPPAAVAEDDVKRWLSLRSELLNNGHVPPCTASASTAAAAGSAAAGGNVARPWTENLNDLAAAVKLLPPFALDIVECDTYNCGGRFLSWGMDRYTFGQPAVMSSVDTIAAALKKFDPELNNHLRDVCMVEFRAFAYKYAHLLLVRDLMPWLSMRLFDTLLSIGSSGCWDFFALFCVAWLMRMKRQLMVDVAPEEALTFLQEPSKIGLPFAEGRKAARWMDELLSRTHMLILQQQQLQQQQHHQRRSSPTAPQFTTTIPPRN